MSDTAQETPVPTHMDEFDAETVMDLVNGSHDRASAGRLDDAVRVLEQAVPMARRLRERNPAHYDVLLHAALLNLEARLSQAGRRDETEEPLRELVTVLDGIIARLADQEAERERHERERIDVLHRLARRSRDNGDLEGALAAARSALEAANRRVSDPFHAGEKAAHTQLLLGELLEAAGRVDESVEATERAVRHQAALLADNPDRDDVDLADATAELGLRLLRHDRHADAEPHLRAAVHRYRPHARAESGEFWYRENLAVCANRLGVALSLTDRDAEAVPHFEEAVGLYRATLAQGVDQAEHYLAGALRDLAVCLIQVDRHEDAVAALQESARLFRSLYASAPDRYHEHLAEVLNRAWRGLRVLGRDQESQRYREEWTSLTGRTE